MSRIKLLALVASASLVLGGCVDALYFMESTQGHSTCEREVENEEFSPDSHDDIVYERASKSYRTNVEEENDLQVQFGGFGDPRLNGLATLSSRTDIAHDAPFEAEGQPSTDAIGNFDDQDGTFTGRLSVRNRDTGAQATGTVNALMFAETDPILDTAHEAFVIKGFFTGSVREVTVPEPEEGSSDSQFHNADPGVYPGGSYFAEVIGFGWTSGEEGDETSHLMLKLGASLNSLAGVTSNGTLDQETYDSLSLADAGVPQSMVGAQFVLPDDSLSVLIPSTACRRI